MLVVGLLLPPKMRMLEYVAIIRYLLGEKALNDHNGNIDSGDSPW